MTTTTATSPTQTQAEMLFRDMVSTFESDGIETANQLKEAAFAIAKAQGLPAEMALREELLRVQWRTLKLRPQQLQSETLKAFKPIADAVNATLDKLINADTKPITWTGEAGLRGAIDVMRDMQSLTVEFRNTPHMPPAATLHQISQIPLRLAMALGRLISDAVPAAYHHNADKVQALRRAQACVGFTSTFGLNTIMEAHQNLQSQMDQIYAVQEWAGERNPLMLPLNAVRGVFGYVCADAAHFDSGSNPQAAMLMAEFDLEYASLHRTLQRCAIS